VQETTKVMLDYASGMKTAGSRTGSSSKFGWFWISANFWLVVAMVLYLGQNQVNQPRGLPKRYTFFGVGVWLSSGEYTMLEVAALLAAAASIGLAIWNRGE